MGEHDVTELLVSWNEGDSSSFDRLLPLVYDELRQLARSQLRGEWREHTLQTTALVHEAYLRLVDQRRVSWNGRAHFFGAAAKAMRRLLVDHARRRKAHKRGSGEDPLRGIELPVERARRSTAARRCDSGRGRSVRGR